MSDQPTLIAIVDDEEPVRKAIGRLLESTGLAVETYGSGRDFLDSLPAARPACVLLDLHMPEMTGLEVLAVLHETNPEIPVVVVTGYHSMDAREGVMSKGAATLLQKPVKDGVLLEAIGAAIQESGGPKLRFKP